MLYLERINQYDKEVKTAVDKLFAKAYKQQSNENDLLLIAVHGYYDESLLKISNPRIPKLNPYVFGPGKDGLMAQSNYEFYDWFRQSQIINIPKSDYVNGKKAISLDQYWRELSITTQIELLVYLKFWESNQVLKQLYNLCRLIHGEPYNWHKQMDSSRKDLIEDEIKKKTQKLVPKFYELMDKIYLRQLRNAIAHSQFRIAGDNLNLFNKDEGAGALLTNMTIEEWEEIFTKTILLYNHIIGNLKIYEDKYVEEARDKHFGRLLRITGNGVEQHVWLKYYKDQWMWYANYRKFEMRLFQIG